jgi:hypothetical protein
LFPDPDKLTEVTPAEVLVAASRGHLGLDHRFLRALIDRSDQALPAVREFAKRDRSNDPVDLAPELISLFRYWKTTDAIPFLIEYVKEDPEHVPDEAIEAFAAIGKPAVEPLLALYGTLEESESGEVAFLLATLHTSDPRILKLLVDRLDFDLSDTLILLGIYGDPDAIPEIEKAAQSLGADSSDEELKKEVAETVQTLRNKRAVPEHHQADDFDIWSLYPETDDLPLDLLDEDERTDLLSHPAASVRGASAHSFFNQDLTQDQQKILLRLAQSDPVVSVRARAWEALINSTEVAEVVEAMLATLRDPATSVEEKGGLLIGLAPEADRNEVRQAIQELYQQPSGRAKALEAMWRSMHPSFESHFARHLSDSDLDVQRGAIWGIGYYAIKSELDSLRKFFENSELRSDALFAYALAMPAEVTSGRIKSILARIEKEAHGLSEMEEELIKAALDERLMLQGKEPIFREQED